jgi:hypothetical protein
MGADEHDLFGLVGDLDPVDDAPTPAPDPLRIVSVG